MLNREEVRAAIRFQSPPRLPRADGFYWRVPAVAAQTKAIDASAYLPDWDDLPALLANLPDTDAPGLFDEAKRRAAAAKSAAAAKQ